jgi:hypothetical protein
MTLTFTDKDIIQYGEKRLTGENLQPEEIRKIELHNGDLPSMLDSEISASGNANREYIQVIQANGREPLYFQQATGTLFIPQYSGYGRARRYQRMIEEYIRASGRDNKNSANNLSFEICDARNEHGERDPRETNINYDNFAYDFTVGLFVPDKKYEEKRIFSTQDVGSIDTIIFGSTKAVARQAEVLEKGNSEYLDSQIVRINGKSVLNIGYIYSDQAGRLLDNILREYDALAKKQGKDRPVNIFMFGEVGGLMRGLSRNQLVYPTGIIDEKDLSESDLPHRGEFMYPMHNILADELLNDHERKQGTPSGLNLNINTSILDETIESLSLAVEKGAICTDMELMEMVGSINKARTRYLASASPTDMPGLDIRFGFVGYISDLPLEGDTRAEELEDDLGERKAVRIISDRLQAPISHH